MNCETRELTILKAWESSEKRILEQFIYGSGVMNGIWSFIPVGFVLKFENEFLKKKCEYYGISPVNLLAKPHVDMHSIAVLMNGNEFRGSGLDRIMQTAKGCVPAWYAAREYGKIEKHIQEESAAFHDWFTWTKKEMPKLFSKWKTHATAA